MVRLLEAKEGDALVGRAASIRRRLLSRIASQLRVAPFSPHGQAVNVLTLTGTWAPGMAVATSSCGELVLRKRAGALGGALGAVEYVSFVGDLTATMHSERDGGPVVPHRWTHPFL